MGIIKNYQPSKGTCKVTFSFALNAAEGVKTIQVLGDFNNWDNKVAPKMKKGKEDFSTSIELNAGQSYEFKYLLDGSRWENDFSADSYVTTPFSGISNSVLVLDAVAIKTPSKASKSAAPKAIKVATPKADKVSAPKVAKAVAPKAAKVSAPKATKTETPKTAKVTAPKVTKTAAPKAAKVTAPKAAKTEAPKSAKVAAPKATKTVTPKAAKVSAPKATKTVATKVTTPKVVKTTTPKPAKVVK